MKIRNQIKFILKMIMFNGVFYGCQSTGYIAKVDESRKMIDLQSQADESSAMRNLYREGVVKKSVEDLETEVKKNPKDLAALLNLTQLYLAQKRLDEAEAICRRALRIDLKNQLARKVLAQIYYRRNNIELANIIINSLDEKSQKDSQVYNLKGLIALRKDRGAEALFLFKEGLKVNPGDVAIRMNLGVLYVNYKLLDQAAVQFERILKVMPDHPDAKLHLAIINSTRKDFSTAQKLYEEILGIDPGNPVATFNMAVLEERRGNYDDAIDYLKSYLDTPYAKSQSNKEAFVLLDRIRSKKEATGEGISELDIQELASKAQRAPISAEEAPENVATSSTAKQAPSDSVSSEKKTIETPTPVVETKSFESDEAEIEALEEALQ